MGSKAIDWSGPDSPMGPDVCREECCGGPRTCKNREEECSRADPESHTKLCYDCMYDYVSEVTHIVHNATVCALCDTVEHYQRKVRLLVTSG